MAARKITKQKVIYGPGTITLNDGATTPTELLALELPEGEVIVLNIEKKRVEKELINGEEINYTKAVKVAGELEYDEFSVEDMESIDDAKQVVIANTKGGANGAGRSWTIGSETDPADIYSTGESNKTKINFALAKEGSAISDVLTEEDNAA